MRFSWPHVHKQQFTPVELLGILGFGFVIGWMLLVCFWLFSKFPYGCDSTTRDLAQLCVFAGMACGYVFLLLLRRKPSFNPYNLSTVIVEMVFAALLPVCALLHSVGIAVPIPAICLMGFAGGTACSFAITAWLDVCSRLSTHMYGRFIGCSFFLGAVLFFPASMNQVPMDSVFGILYFVSSMGFLVFANSSAEVSGRGVPLDFVGRSWEISKDVAPSFFMFCATFGMAFNWLFNADSHTIAFGLLSVIPAALCIALLSWLNISVDITLVMRILLCLCVFACVFMSQVSSAGKTLCSCLIIFAWTMFMSLSYSFAIKKSVVMRDAPFFRQAPQRFAILAFGFAAGWGTIYLGAQIFGDGSNAIVTISLSVAVLLVAVFVLFFPQHAHLNMDGGAEVSSNNPLGLDSQELFSLRTKCVARDNQLSPRETDVFQYLARGRNAAYIQQKLVISPCTVKSHIHNIYRKLDVHSQQQLIGMVEDYTVDPSDYDLRR